MQAFYLECLKDQFLGPFYLTFIYVIYFLFLTIWTLQISLTTNTPYVSGKDVLTVKNSLEKSSTKLFEWFSNNFL